MIPKALESIVIRMVKNQLKKHLPKIGDLIPPNLTERIKVLEKKVDLIQEDMREMAKVSNNQLNESMETLAKLLKDS